MNHSYFTDELKLEIYGSNRRMHVRLQRGQKMIPQLTAYSRAALNGLHPCQEKVWLRSSKTCYPSGLNICGEWFTLQQDNEPNTPQSFARTTWSLRKIKEWRLSFPVLSMTVLSSTVIWPQAQWTLLGYSKDCEGQVCTRNSLEHCQFTHDQRSCLWTIRLICSISKIVVGCSAMGAVLWSNVP